MTFLLFLSSFTLIADGFLFLGMLTRLTAILSVLIAGIVTWRLDRMARAGRRDAAPSETRPSDPRRFFFRIIFLLSTIAFFRILLAHPVTVAVRTPWTALPAGILVAFGLMAASGFACASLTGFSLPFVPLLFGFLGLTTLLFPLGYGFDSFLHRAAEDFIVQHGFIEPMPVLYGGHYALIAALHHLTGIGVDALDRLLVPSIAAIVLPNLFRRLSRHALVIAVLFFLPLSLLTITTPFAFATLLFLATALVVTHGSREERFAIGLPVALAATSIHLLAGVPTLIMIGLSFLRERRALITAAIASAFAVPVLMMLNVVRSGAKLSFVLDARRIAALFAIPLPQTTFRPYEDFAYLAGACIVMLLGVLFVLGIRMKERSTTLTSLLAAALALGVSAVLLSGLTLPDVISYEQSDYAKRLLVLAILALTPFFALGIEGLIERFSGAHQQLPRELGLILLALLVTSHFYLLYPRADRHFTNKGFNVTQADFNAVKSVKSDAHGVPFLILAPQTTSAAYVRQFGFPADDRTLALPTGAPLYRYFVAMTEQLDPNAVPAAMTFTQRKLAYVMLPTWWWRFEDVKTTLDRLASGSYLVQDVMVWKFER